MKQLIIKVFILLVFTTASVNAQQFLSINPDFSPSNQTISTVVTSSNFFFTQGSAPNVWGDFYMIQGSQYIYPNSISVIDDDHLNVSWTLPQGAPIGNYNVRWEISFQNYFPVPGGFNIDCIAPPAQLSNPVINYYCSNGGSVTLQANAGTGFTYDWYNNNIHVATTTVPTYTTSNGGTYNVKVTNAQGCARYSSEVYLYPVNPPGAAVISPATNTAICPGSSILLTANTGSNLTYQWLKNGVQINGANLSTYNTSDSGSYTVRVTNSSGCSSLSTARLISIAPLPPSYVTANGPLTFCAGNSVKLKTSAGTGYSYQWYKYGNPIAGATGQSLVVTSTGSYKVMVTNSYGCTKKSGNQNVSVLNAPLATITPAGPTAICAGDSVKLNANNGSGYTYYWKRYGVTIAGATASSYTAKNGGSYKVVVTNSNGCSKLSAPVTVSVVCREGIPTETNVSETDIFPNPASDVLNITGQNIQKIEIVNVEGKIVGINQAGNTQSVSVEELPKGLYMAVIYLENDIVTKRFLKQ